MKFCKLFYVVLVSSMVMVLSGCGKGENDYAKSSTPVKAIKIEQKDVKIDKEYPGQVKNKNEIKIQPRISGNVVEKMFSGGEFVAQGQALFKIDATQYENTLLSAKASLLESEIALENAQLDEARYENLYQTGAITEQRLTTHKATVRQNEAIVNSKMGILKKAQDDFDNTVIYAPIAGRVDINDISVGTYAQAGSTVLVTMGNIDSVFVQFNMSENEYLNAHHNFETANNTWGEKVRLVLSNGAEYSEFGKVLQVDRSLKDNSGTLAINAVFDNPKGLLLPGMFARVAIEGDVRKATVLVPQRAVQQILDKTFVMLVDENSKVVQHAVKIGEAVGSYYIVEEGLQAEDLVVVEGLTKINDGTSVDVSVISPEDLALTVN